MGSFPFRGGDTEECRYGDEGPWCILDCLKDVIGGNVESLSIGSPWPK